MMTFVNPLNALIPKSHFHFFAGFRVRVTSGARGSVSVGFGGGGASIERFLGDATPTPTPYTRSPCANTRLGQSASPGARIGRPGPHLTFDAGQ